MNKCHSCFKLASNPVFNVHERILVLQIKNFKLSSLDIKCIVFVGTADYENCTLVQLTIFTNFQKTYNKMFNTFCLCVAYI